VGVYETINTEGTKLKGRKMRIKLIQTKEERRKGTIGNHNEGGNLRRYTSWCELVGYRKGKKKPRRKIRKKEHIHKKKTPTVR